MVRVTIVRLWLAVSVLEVVGCSAGIGSGAGGPTAASGAAGAAAPIAGVSAGGAGMAAAGTAAPTAGNLATAGMGAAASGGLAGTGTAGTSSAGLGSAGMTGAAGTAGHNASGSGGSAGAAGSAGGCPTTYTMANLLVMDVSWDGTFALNAGSGKVYTWVKTKFVENGANITTETITCGTTLPVIMTTPIAGGNNVLPEIPNTAWDSAANPKVMGTATKSGNMLTVNPVAMLVGMTLTDAANAAWPAATQIMTVDQDSDGKPGVTAIPREGNGFAAPPTSVAQTSVTDKIYLVSRVVSTSSATVVGCPETQSGTGTVSKFDNHVVGCHVKGGAECSADEAAFVDSNSPAFKPTAGSGKFTAKRVADTATCAEVRAAVPAQ
jgi:hypothetical protein